MKDSNHPKKSLFGPFFDIHAADECIVNAVKAVTDLLYITGDAGKTDRVESRLPPLFHNTKLKITMSTFANLRASLREAGYYLFTLLDGRLTCSDCPGWSCAISSLHIPIKVYPDSLAGAMLYVVQCPDGKLGTFTIDHPSLDIL